MSQIEIRKSPLKAAFLKAGILSAAALALLVSLLALGGSLPLPTRGASVSKIVSPGMTAPDFSLTAQDGRTFHLADYQGRAVFLAFVPSWTDSKTIQEVRALAKAAGEFDLAGAKVFVVADENGAEAEALHRREKLPFPLLLDKGGEIARQFGVPQGDFRTTFVVAPAGKVKFRVSDAAVNPADHGKQLLEISGCCIDEVTAARASGVGKKVGEYSLPRADKNGTMETLYGDGTQKATVALFLSVKCPCANAYNDRLPALADAYAARGIRFVGIYSNKDETMAEIAAHAREHRFSFPVLKDERGLGADHLGASVTPEVFVLDSDRVLRYAGHIDGSRVAAEAKTHELKDTLDALLAGRPQGVPKATRAFGCGIVR
ncbi:MAG: redoxin domain-containing protein [Armatimonadota bacterium]